MLIGGMQKFSLIDYPGKISAIIFTQGCNFRCQFCYNPTLVWPQEKGETNQDKKGETLIAEDAFFDFLASRRNKLDALVITGGEPTLQPDLAEFIKKVKDRGFLVKLDTNGTRPGVIRALIKKDLIDYLAMDIKASAVKYEQTAGVKVALDDIIESIKLIRESGLPHEFRSTLVPGLVELIDIEAMAGLIAGAEKWYLQRFKPDTELVNPQYQAVRPFSLGALEEMRALAKKYVKECYIR